MNERKKFTDIYTPNLSYPLAPDRTALETHYSRSRKIRSRIYSYLVLMAKDSRSFGDRSDLAYQAANVAKCSYETSLRWINQYASSNGDFYFFDDEHRIGWRRQQ